MNAKRGYYSLIQFCPDPSKSEAVNVGVLLFCPELGFIAARNRRDNKRPRKLIYPEKIDSASLNAAKQAIENRLKVERETFKSLEDLQKFVDTRANVFKLTPPRPVKVFDPKTDLERLFKELVGGIAREKTSLKTCSPKLKTFFKELYNEGRAELNLAITIPVLGNTLHIPFKFNNEVPNFVRPCSFSGKDDQAIGRAQQLAIDGDLLYNNSMGKLVVVTTFETSQKVAVLKNRIDGLFRKYNVEPIHEEDIDRFITHVKEVAH
ncbi:MAG: DUF3037 domain-containing protein [Thermoguttaceae bacterium]